MGDLRREIEVGKRVVKKWEEESNFDRTKYLLVLE